MIVLDTSRAKLESLYGKSSSFTEMSDREVQLFTSIIREEMSKREKSGKVEQIREIAPIEHWINSPYFLGNDYNSIYPYWKNLICDIFSSKRTKENNINQVILGGSLGVGKSTAAELITLRKLYELSCYKNINSMFGLMSKTNIMFFYFSINKTQAESTGFGELRSFIDHSPYFKDHFRRRERLDSLLVFPEGITVAYGSRSSDSIGMSVLCQILDEANFAGGNGSNSSGNAEKALDMYAGMINRANSRFIIEGGHNHSLSILVSSATHESSATERQIALSKDDPHTIVASPSQWEVKPEKFSKKFFYVLKGTNYLEPQIIESTDDINNFRLSEGIKKEKFIDGLTDFDSIEKEIQKLPPHHQNRFLKVPVDLKRGFEMNIIRSLQDLGGVSTGSTGKLFNSPQVYDDCIDKNFFHPFVASELVISTGDKVELKDYLRSDYYFRHPERNRYIHIDQSTTTDSTGIACVYIEDLEEDPVTGMKKPIVGVDFVLRINPPKPPKKIAIYKIRNFVVFLGRSLGLRLGRVTYDIFNSEESRQILEEMGFNVAYQSVDRTDKAYLDLVEIMYEGRLKLYNYPILRHELFNLIHYRDKRKVDHPKTVNDSSYTGKGSNEGSKDVSDALCLSADTKLYLLSGRDLTIEELYNSDNSDEWVLACDCDNKKVVPVKVQGVIKKHFIPSKLIEIELDSGDIIKVTKDHLILMRDGSYCEAGKLKAGDSLMPFITGERLTWKNYYRTVKSPFGGRPENIYRLVVHTVKQDEWNTAQARLLGDKDFVVTHHINHNKKDDRPSNLQPMTNAEHRRLHGDIFVKYNKSDKHREDNKRAYREGRCKGFRAVWENDEYVNKVKEAGRKTLIKYNKSEKHKDDIRRAYKEGRYQKSIDRFIDMAKDPETHKRALETKRKTGVLDRYAKMTADWNRDKNMIKKQLLGKVQKIKALLEENTDVLNNEIVSLVDISLGCAELVNKGLIKKGYGVPYDEDLWGLVGIELYHIKYKSRWELRGIKTLVQEVKNLYYLANKEYEAKFGVVTLQKMEDIFNRLKNKGILENGTKFSNYTYEIFLLAHIPLHNHSVKSVRVVDNREPVYDLQLSEIHNFGISAGIFVHNCGAVASLLKDSIAESSGSNSTIEEFLEANKTHTYFEPDPMSADDMLDKMIEDAIDEMEMGGNQGGFGYF